MSRSTLFDITDRKLVEGMLRESETRLKEMFENLSSAVAVYRTSPDGRDFYFATFNRAAERIESRLRSEVIGKNVVEVFPGVTEFGLLDVFRRVWKTGVAEHFAVALYHDGNISTWRENYVYKLPQGEVVAIYEDITQQKQVEEQILHHAQYDMLTGLSNRLLLFDRLRQAIARSRRKGVSCALMFFDLDKFKYINDTLGHEMGDNVLSEAARRLQDTLRESNTVARLGGDEFVVLLPVITTKEDAGVLAEKIRQAISHGGINPAIPHLIPSILFPFSNLVDWYDIISPLAVSSANCSRTLISDHANSFRDLRIKSFTVSFQVLEDFIHKLVTATPANLSCQCTGMEPWT